ncbi:MAG: aromatic-ring-hydroxylating dioxygenase subunit beta [Nocardioides sp.]|uniref:aromatic-ring-hydroxylating dioxygenase subunit beta n=1 Tax=Nocardioides sp. TaxID=35761 RepID=UPI0039E389D5
MTLLDSRTETLEPTPDGWSHDEVAQFLYREARHADENDYDAWEALWTDDALYWVPANGADTDPETHVAVIYDNRNRISTRLKQVRTGKRYAQAPPSDLRRIIGNIELLGGRRNGAGDLDLEVGANFLAFESRLRVNELWGGRVTYRLRRIDGEIRLAYKKVVLVDNDKPIPTMAFLI